MTRLLKQHPDLHGLDAGSLLDFLWEKGVHGMAFVGTSGDWLAVNPALCAWLGYAPTELENMTFMDVTMPGDTAADLAAVDEVVRGIREAYTMSKTYLPKQGQPFDARLTVEPWRMPDGTTVAFLYSQIQRAERVEFTKVDELRVIANFLGKHRRYVLIFLIAVALTGEGFISWLMGIIQTVAAL